MEGVNGCVWVLMVYSGCIDMGKPGGTQKRGTEEQETVRWDVFRTASGLKFTSGMGGRFAAGVGGEWEESGWLCDTHRRALICLGI